MALEMKRTLTGQIDGRSLRYASVVRAAVGSDHVDLLVRVPANPPKGAIHWLIPFMSHMLSIEHEDRVMWIRAIEKAVLGQDCPHTPSPSGICTTCGEDLE